MADLTAAIRIIASTLALAATPAQPARHDATRLVRVPAVATNSQIAPIDLRQAYDRLHRAGLRVAFHRAFAFTPVTLCLPVVAAQRPAAHSRVPRATVVRLRLRRPLCPAGSPAVPTRMPSAVVPDFIGRPAQAAYTWTNRHRLSFQTNTLAGLEAGAARHLLGNYTITRQQPAAGTTLKLGTGTSHPTPTGMTGIFRPTPLRVRAVRR